MIYVINRYNTKSNYKNFSGYEHIVKYDNDFVTIESPNWLAKLISKLPLKKPIDYLGITYGREVIAFFLAFITGRPVFYLYADKDAFLLPILKRKLKLKRIKIYGTLHWPREISDEYSFYKFNLEQTFNGIISLTSNKKLLLKTSRKVIPHGIDLKFWENKNPQLNNNSFYLLLGQSNRNHKGQLKILEQLLKFEPNAKFVALITNPEIAQPYEKIKNVNIVKQRVSDNELKELYIACKAVILIQHNCLASNVVLETIAMQRPIIANNVGDIKEYLGKEHKFISLKNPSEFLFEFNESTRLRKNMMDNFSIRRKEYQWEKIAKTTKKFIE